MRKGANSSLVDDTLQAVIMDTGATATAAAATTTPSTQNSPPLSRTCQNCVTSKIKCIRRENSSSCERCTRLNKECIFRVAKRRNNGTRNDMRIVALEAKFKQLLEAHNSSAADGVKPQGINQARGSSSSASPVLMTTSSSQYATSVGTEFVSDGMKDAEASRDIQYRGPQDVVDSGLISLETADFLLDIFKTTMNRHFPFVLIAPHTKAEELRYWKPFLFLTILAVASFEDVKLQNALGDEVKQVVCSRMILRGEISFDLLQGLLVHLAWCQHLRKPRLYTQFLHLAVSIVVDMRLDQHPQARAWKTAVSFKAENITEQKSLKASWSDDEQRAVAGLFYLSSSTSLVLQKMTTFPHSMYIETCCQHLLEKNEYPTDKYLLYIVQLQHISEKVDQLFAQYGRELGNPDPAVELRVMVLKSELEIFKERLPISMKEYHPLFVQYHIVELYLFQISLIGQHGQSHTDHLVKRPSWHLKILCAGLTAAKSTFDIFLSLPLRAELAFSNSEWIQMGFALIIGCRFSLETPESAIYAEAQKLRRSLDMSSVLRQCAVRTQSLKAANIDLNNESNVYKVEQRIRLIQTWFHKYSPENSWSDSTSSFGHNPQNSGSSLSQQLDDFDNVNEATHLPATDGIYDIPLQDYFADSMDEVMDDWMSYSMVEF